MKPPFDIAADVEACITRARTVHILADTLISTSPRTANAIAQAGADLGNALEAVRDALYAQTDTAGPLPAPAIPDEYVPTVAELTLPDLLAAGMALLPIAEALSAARNRRDLTEAVLGFLLPLREAVDDALFGIVGRVEEAKPTNINEACDRSRLLLANMGYRDEATSYIAEVAAQLARDEMGVR